MRTTLVAGLAAALIAAAPASQGPFVADGPPLSGDLGSTLGRSIALSADGSTALVGAPTDTTDLPHVGSGLYGSVWVLERGKAGWTRTARLTRPPGETRYHADVGRSVGLSADGSTALVGAPGEQDDAGAVWVFTRSASGWTRRTQLRPKGAQPLSSGAELFGRQVALSADGGTALVCGGRDDDERGAAFVFVRAGSTWRQDGPKLTGPRVEPGGTFCTSAALSGDGRTALIGRFGEVGRNRQPSTPAAAFVFARWSAGWRLQGATLIALPPDRESLGGFARGVALSADGDTALITQYRNDADDGAVWVFTRKGAAWTRGPLLKAGRSPTGSTWLGRSVALSADGGTALAGSSGAAWVFVRRGETWTRDTHPLIAPSTATPRGREFGQEVALSADGTTAFVGAQVYDENGETLDEGTVWPFRRGP